MDGVGTSIIEGLDPCLQPHHPPFTGMSRQSSGGRLPVGWMGRGAGAELSVNRSPRKSLPMMTIEASISQASRSEDPLSATPRIGIILGSTRPGRVGGQGTTWDRPSSPRRRPPR